MNTFEMKTAIHFGDNALDRLKEIPYKRVLIITDPFVVQSKMINLITAPLNSAGIEYDIFHDVVPDAPVDKIAEGVKKFLEYQPEAVVAVGGGSAIDSSKAIREFALKINNYGKVGLIAIPTTSGTGSEVTSFAVVNDTAAHVKYPLISESLTADEAILDAELVRSVPPAITADTGMDVFTHALESYVSTAHNEFSSALAEKAIEICGVFLLRAYLDGSDMHARKKMHVASCLAGLSFNTAGLGITHSMAHQLGAMFHIPHGRANAMLLPHIVEFNSDINKHSKSQKEYLPAVKRYANVAHILGLSNYNKVMTVRSLVNWIQFMQKEMNIPLTIQELGTIAPEEYFAAIDKMADAALADGVYTPDKFSWSGGTGKVSISCTKITVTGGQAYATIVFSSGSYGYVKANGNTYYPTTTGSTSTFVIPVELNKNNTIIGMTTKMSTAHEISYSIFIYLSAAAKADGTTVSGETNLSADTLDEKAPEIMGLSYQSETKVEHAKYFKIYHYDQGITLLEIDQRKDEDTKETKTKDTKEDTDSGLTPAQEEKLALYKAKIVRYLIVPEDAEIPAGLDKEMIVIQKPKKSAYVGSEEVLEILDKLNATDQITSVGVKQKNCKVEGIAKAMKAKKIIYAGTYKKPENKKLMKSKCDLAILSNKIFPDEKNEKKMSVEDQQKRYEELAEKFVLLDVPMIVDRSADEEKDDAKAEWSKVYEAIFAQTDSTDSSAKN